MQELPRQPSLWEAEQVQAAAKKAERLTAALEQVQARFGVTAVRRGTALLPDEAHAEE